MSRPPRPFPRVPASSSGRAPSWRTLLEIQRELAARELGLVPRGAEGDFVETLFELSAVVAHVLGMHADHYVAESHFATAVTRDSLARHGQRLAYAPDPGLSATGFVALELTAQLDGELPVGLTMLGSSPGGKVQQFESVEPRRVAAAWNRIEPGEATITRAIIEGDSELTLSGLRLGIAPGELVVLAKLDVAEAGFALRVREVEEDRARRQTTLRFEQPPPPIEVPSAWRLFVDPSERHHLFGWSADPETFPPAELQAFGYDFEGPGAPGSGAVYGWRLDGVVPPTTEETESTEKAISTPTTPPLALPKLVHELFFDWVVERRIEGEPLVVVQDGQAVAYRVAAGSQREVSVAFHAADDITYISDPDLKKDDDEVEWTARVHRWLSGSVTQFKLCDRAGTFVERDTIDPRSTVLTGWRRQLELAPTRPNPAAHVEGDALLLDAHHTGLEPGFLVALSDRDGTRAQIVELSSVETTTTAAGPRTRVTWHARTNAPPGGWTLGDLVVLGNVIPVGHGKRHEQILGSSNGVTPFQRFTLVKPQVSQVPGRDGAEPVLEVRVAGVRWTRVEQLSTSGPDDRHYRVEIDDEQRLSIVFGDGRNGAVPSAGRRHITASYRVGLGRAGNLAAGQLSRMAKRHPLITKVRNPLPLAGGSDPATAASLRHRATRWVRTVGRAVSVSDHADLALIYPGVVRASASFDPERGIVLAVAGEDGAALADLAPLRAFLDGRRDTRLRLEIVAPERVAVHLALSVALEPGYPRAIVEQAVQRALVAGGPERGALFDFGTRDIGAPAHLSEIYAVANDIEGVHALEVTHFALAEPDPPTVHDQLRVSPQQWLHLAALDFDFAIFVEGVQS